MIFNENRLPADGSREISCLICYFRKGGKTLNCCLLQIIGGALNGLTVCQFPGSYIPPYFFLFPLLYD